MGKTYRNEKTYNGKKSRINNHRDIPDSYYDNDKYDEDYPYDEEEAEEYYAKKIRSKE